MSRTLPNTTERLKEAINFAKNSNIVMFSSPGGGGANRKSVWLADHEGVISISSLTNFGRRPDSTETNASYFFQEESISLPAEPSYLESQKHASGISVATALAAGVAALILSCRRLVDKRKRMDSIQTVTKVFDQMTGRDDDKYVKPWEVFKDKHLEQEEGLRWLKGKFGKNGDSCYDLPLWPLLDSLEAQEEGIY